MQLDRDRGRRSHLAGDRRLAEAARRGCPRASERLVAEHAPRMRAVARRMLRNDLDADEVVQDAFLQAFRHIERYRGDARLSTWLHRITCNAALMRLRKRRRTPEVAAGDLLDEVDATGPAAAAQAPGDPETLAAGAQRGRRVLRLARELPEPYRTVLWLRDVCELDTGEVAAEMGTTRSAVKTRLHRARAALRRALEAEESAPSPVAA
ncbi:MAG: sigma-70 family RNA polymerase sigma factor [Myxococcota bacterium]|nr:sigma-70 family RNA polymerase sigma factor [Myxococcota bacterium]